MTKTQCICAKLLKTKPEITDALRKNLPVYSIYDMKNKKLSYTQCRVTAKNEEVMCAAHTKSAKSIRYSTITENVDVIQEILSDYVTTVTPEAKKLDISEPDTHTKSTPISIKEIVNVKSVSKKETKSSSKETKAPSKETKAPSKETKALSKKTKAPSNETKVPIIEESNTVDVTDNEDELEAKCSDNEDKLEAKCSDNEDELEDKLEAKCSENEGGCVESKGEPKSDSDSEYEEILATPIFTSDTLDNNANIELSLDKTTLKVYKENDFNDVYTDMGTLLSIKSKKYASIFYDTKNYIVAVDIEHRGLPYYLCSMSHFIFETKKSGIVKVGQLNTLPNGDQRVTFDKKKK
jgi:hypothetical protein